MSEFQVAFCLLFSTWFRFCWLRIFFYKVFFLWVVRHGRGQQDRKGCLYEEYDLIISIYRQKSPNGYVKFAEKPAV
ncbi:hypothetical protein HMPREF1640_09235 [Prevotella sp. S7-1-8]|nr:hypothetical protein HMPREF1640_09235 [Prevotella sp. S7-1-8]